MMSAGRPDLLMVGHIAALFWNVQAQKQILSEPGTFRTEKRGAGRKSSTYLGLSWLLGAAGWGSTAK